MGGQKRCSDFELPLIPLVAVWRADSWYHFRFGFDRSGVAPLSQRYRRPAELVASSSLVQRVSSAGEEGISTNRTKLLSMFGWNFGPEIQVSLPDRCVAPVAHGSDVRHHSRLWPYVQRRARKSERARVRRLDPRSCALSHFRFRQACLWASRFAAATKFELRPPATWPSGVRVRVARRRYGRPWRLCRPNPWARFVTLLSLRSVDLHRNLATRFRTSVHRHDRFRAGRIIGPSITACAAVARLFGTRSPDFGKLLVSYSIALSSARDDWGVRFFWARRTTDHVVEKTAEGPTMHFLGRTHGRLTDSLLRRGSW